MREEYISLSPVGAFALAMAGFLFGQALDGTSVAPTIGLAVVCLLIVRSDAMERVRPGTYSRRWFVWRRIGDVE